MATTEAKYVHSPANLPVHRRRLQPRLPVISAPIHMRRWLTACWPGSCPSHAHCCLSALALQNPSVPGAADCALALSPDALANAAACTGDVLGIPKPPAFTPEELTRLQSFSLPRSEQVLSNEAVAMQPPCKTA